MSRKKERATFGQASQILSVIMDQKPTVDQLDALLEMGILTQLLNVDLRKVDRSKIMKVLGLPVAEIRSQRRMVLLEKPGTLSDLLGKFKGMKFPPQLAAEDISLEGLAPVYDLKSNTAGFHADEVTFTENIWVEDAVELLAERKLRLATLHELFRVKLRNVDRTSWYAGPIGTREGKEVIAMVQGDKLCSVPTSIKIGKGAYFITLPE